MKCANCGYFNLPGAQICGRCSRSLIEASGSNHAEVLAPPRRSQRSARAQLEASISPAARRILRRESPFARFIVRSAPQNEETWAEFTSRAASVLLSIVPGLSQLLGKRYLLAFIFCALSFASIAGFAFTFYQQVSDAFLQAFVVLSFLSIFENLSHDDRGRRSLPPLRLIRHGLLSVTYLAAFAVFGLSYIHYRFTPFQVGDVNNAFAAQHMGFPVIRPGDNLVFEEFDFDRVHRGDLVLQSDDELVLYNGLGRIRTENALWKVVGLPGDTVTSKQGALYVNNRAVPKNWVPAYFKAPDGISKRVPMGELALVGVLFGYQVQPTGPPSRFTTLPYPKLTRRLLAITGPPARRQLFR